MTVTEGTEPQPMCPERQEQTAPLGLSNSCASELRVAESYCRRGCEKRPGRTNAARGRTHSMLPWVPVPATAVVLKVLLEPEVVMEFAYSRSLKDG